MESRSTRFDMPASSDMPTHKTKRKSRFDAPSSVPIETNTSDVTASSTSTPVSQDGGNSYLHPHSPASFHQGVSGFNIVPPPPGAVASQHEFWYPPPPPPPPPSAVEINRPGLANGLALIPHAIELCNVGAMVKALQSYWKNSDGCFVPYTPVPRDITIPECSLPSTITEVENNRVEDFYDKLEELLESMDGSSVIQDKAFDYSRRKYINANKNRSIPMRVISEQDLMRRHESIRAEGFSFSSMPSPLMGSTPQHVTGTLEQETAENEFNSFRKKRAMQYHDRMALKDVMRKDTSVMLLSSQALCYKCNRPGHHAKDCSYFPV